MLSLFIQAKRKDAVGNFRFISLVISFYIVNLEFLILKIAEITINFADFSLARDLKVEFHVSGC